MFKKKRNREIIWGQDNKVREDDEIPKPEVILGPAGDSSVNGNTANENAMGFLGTMATAASSGTNLSPETSSFSSSEERPRSSPYGWVPSDNPDSGSISPTSSYPSSDSDQTEKIFRLQRKIDNLVERIEALERKLDRN